MSEVDVLGVVGTCAPERSAYALALAAVTDRSLVPARRLRPTPDAVEAATALALRGARRAGAVIEFPSDARPTEIIGALARPGSGVRLSGIVCVADAAHLLDDLRRESYATRPLVGTVAHDGTASTAGSGGPILEHTAHAMLTATQLEYASMIVLVNWQGLATRGLAALMALVSHLSPHARLRLDHGATPVPEPGPAYSVAQERPGWVAVLNDAFDPHMTDPRVAAVRHQQVRPLHPGRLERLLDDRLEPGEFGTVVRSAGSCRLATRPGIVAEWSHVGRMFSLEPLGRDDGLGDELLSVGQDLAFIGIDLDAAALDAALDAAALSDEELAAGPAVWSRMRDPFPAWHGVPGGAE